MQANELSHRISCPECGMYIDMPDLREWHRRSEQEQVFLISFAFRFMSPFEHKLWRRHVCCLDGGEFRLSAPEWTMQVCKQRGMFYRMLPRGKRIANALDTKSEEE